MNISIFEQYSVVQMLRTDPSAKSWKSLGGGEGIFLECGFVVQEDC